MKAPRRLSALLLTPLLIAGCGAAGNPGAPSGADTGPVTCATLPARIVDAVQVYVDSFGQTEATGLTGAVTARQSDFTSTAAELRAQGEDLGCDPTDLAAGVRDELRRLRGGTAVQDAIAATFRAGPLGTADPSDTGPVTLHVRTAEELVAAVAYAGSGSVVRLAAGEYRLTQPLVLLRPVTLVGGGADETVLRSTASEGAVIIATDGDATLRDLAVVHSGAASASVVMVAAGGYVLERLRVSGGAADSGTGGFGIVLRSVETPLLPAGGRRELTGVELRDNPAGGVLVAGTEDPRIRDVRVTASEGCGLCFVERSTGWVAGGEIGRTQVGIRVDDAAAPDVSGARVSESSVGIAFTGSGAPRVTDSELVANDAGIQITGDGAATITRTTVSDSGSVGVRVSGSTTASLTDLTITGGTMVGVAVIGSARPTIAGIRVASTGDVGLIWAEAGSGTARGVVVAGPRLGLQLTDTAAPTLDAVTVEGASAASLLATGASGGSVKTLACAPDSIVALEERTTVALVDVTGCEVVDYR